MGSPWSGSVRRDPGHSLLTRERGPTRDGGSGGLVWPAARGRHPTFIAVNGPQTPASAGVKQGGLVEP
jgi:hypothetical protein